MWTLPSPDIPSTPIKPWRKMHQDPFVAQHVENGSGDVGVFAADDLGPVPITLTRLPNRRADDQLALDHRRTMAGARHVPG
jgi:hypothetical protein